MTREEAIEKVREMKLSPGKDAELIIALHTLIPELRESEDERIRKELIGMVKFHCADEHLDRYLNWLEKQKGKMAAEEFESSELFQLKLKTKYANGYQDGLAQKEQKPADRFEEAREKYQVEWSEEDDQLIGFIFDLLNDLVWRKDWAMSKEECLERLKYLRPQYHGDVTMTEAYKMGLEVGKASSWKPSKEQIDALQSAIIACESEWVYQDDELRSLLTDLKKLM